MVYHGELVLQWAGGWRGYVSHLLAVPSRRIAACAFANRTSANAAEALAFSLLDRAAGWERLPWAKRLEDQKREFRRQGADGTSADFSEIIWDLRPVVEGERVVAWMFGPDDPAAPCRFDRIGILASSTGVRHR